MTNHAVPADRADRSGRLLSIDDVASLLNVSRKTVYRLTSAGELVPSRVVGRLRYRPDEVDEYIERHREKAP
jgi:excisionase family DNA binding protein